MRVVAAMIVMVFSGPALAEETMYPVSIPQECFELAAREGVPTVIENRYQGLRAKAKLARLSSRDPLVRECRAAVHRAGEGAARYH